ncbi:MAG: hypothetical protein Q8S00_16390 [Deltaproteobacteria bacterium]|nr:hypothetical protein [Deltaproteobacteria bacterium]MDZ4344142.1 hypothetical protein [Candidatus Binatia bacterium]
MKRHRLFHLSLLLAALAWCSRHEAAADSWAAAQVKEGFSTSRDHFVRIIPGESLGDTVGFAGEGKGKFARAEFYHRGQDSSYRLAARATLSNPIAPVEFFVSDDGRLATLDNWHNLGYGKVVSLYDSKGQPLRAYELSDLFQADEISAFQHSVSSIHWRKGPAYIRQDQKTLLMTIKSGGDFLFGLETGLYKYCEYHETIYRCRNRNQPRQWLPNDQLPLFR